MCRGPEKGEGTLLLADSDEGSFGWPDLQAPQFIADIIRIFGANFGSVCLFNSSEHGPGYYGLILAMATAKIATLAIRTLAKPIATQLKNQAAQHETFRNICIALAQRMHRTEMALRINLLNGVPQKVRPLNDAKAIANGANAISEGFLFAVAAALILGETYRGSRKNANQRDRTEESLNQLREEVEKLANILGLSIEQLDRKTLGNQAGPSQEVSEEIDPSLIEARLHIYQAQQDQEIESKRTQAAVQVLLRLALKNQWVAGKEALELQGILGGSDVVESPEEADVASSSEASPQPLPNTAQLSIAQQVAQSRARTLAEQARNEHLTASDPHQRSQTDPSPTLIELLEQYQQKA